MVEQPDGGPVEPPTKSVMTACEVMTWIAFRRAIPKERLESLFRGVSDRWVVPRVDAVLEALEARAGIAEDGPFCAINWTDSRDSLPFRRTAFTRDGPSMLRLIRAQHRRETGKLLSYADLARMLHEDLDADERVWEQLKEAKAQLRDRAASGSPVRTGIPVEPNGKQGAFALVEALPATLFMRPQ